MSNKIPVWIDCDTGVDDSFALISAFKLPNLDIKGISTVCGNVELEKTFKNTRNILSLIGKEDIKVYKGAYKPFCVELHTASDVHGSDGIGGAKLDESKAPIETKYAWDALYECAKENKGLHVVAVGPLTNIATTIAKYPDFLEYISEIDMMGGAVGVQGNITQSAEFNIYVDPHAAQTVFKSGVKIVMFGLDVTLKTCLHLKDIEEIISFNNPASNYFNNAYKTPMNRYKELGYGEVIVLHDSCPLFYLNDPSLFKGKMAGVYVETLSNITLGKTISDLYVHSDDMFKKNTLVMLDVDRDRVAKAVIDTFKEYN